MGGGDEFLGVGADAVFKASAERVLGVGKDPAGRGNGTFSVLQSAHPVGAAGALHFVLLLLRNKKLLDTSYTMGEILARMGSRIAAIPGIACSSLRACRVVALLPRAQ